MTSSSDFCAKAVYQSWEENRGRLLKRKGGWLMGEGVFCHGYNMMDELVGQASYMQVMMLNITGKLPERRLADWMEALHICLSWPDPRIWCNQIGALAGTVRTSVVAATTAGTLAADSRLYGGLTNLKGVTFIQTALRRVQQGLSVEALIEEEIAKHNGKVNIMGFARPIAKGDERVEAMERVTNELGFEAGEHLRLVYKIDSLLQSQHEESMNINAFACAFLSDQGFTAKVAYELCAMLVMSGVSACFLDAESKPAEEFLPLRCDDVIYTGQAPRPLPER